MYYGNCTLNTRGGGLDSKVICIEREILIDLGRKVGRSLIYKEKRTGPKTEPWELFFGDGKDDYMNYRYGLSNGDLRGRIVSIQQSKEEDLKRGV